MVAADVIAAARRPNKPRKVNDAGVSKAMQRDVPNSRLYAELRELDLRIEQYTNRKKAEVCDLSQALDEHLTTRCLRLFLYNQHFNQGGTSEKEPPSWSFYIYGHFVSQGQAAQPEALQDAADKKKEQQWTAAMTSIEIKITHKGEDAPPPEIVRWERSTHVGAHREAIEVHRARNTPASITVTMVRDSAPEHCRVNGVLAEILSMRSGTRGQVMRELWRRIQASSTASAENPAIVRLSDDALVPVFGDRELNLATVGQRMESFLSPMPPVVLHYDVQLDGSSPSTPQCFDVEVAWQLKPSMLKLPAQLDANDIKPRIEECDREIADNLSQLKQSHWRYMFYQGFATNPTEFIQRLIAQSAKEVGVDPTHGHLVPVTSSMYKLPWASEAVMKYVTEHLERAQAAGGGRGSGMGA